MQPPANVPHAADAPGPAPVAPVGTGDDSITRLLASAGDGHAEAWHRIYDLLYDDLHRIARSQIRRRSG